MGLVGEVLTHSHMSMSLAMTIHNIYIYIVIYNIFIYIFIAFLKESIKMHQVFLKHDTAVLG